VSWKQRVSVVVVVLFTALPVSGTLCALMCDSAAAAASAHHGSGKDCEDAAHDSTGVQLESASDRDCSNHDAAIRQVASTVSERVELKTAAIAFGLSAGHTSFDSLPLSAPALEDAGPPGAAPRTTAPLVLRV
jgi:hypothetical protein